MPYAAGVRLHFNFTIPPQLAVGHPSRMICYYYFLEVSIFSPLGASTSVPKLMAAIGGFFSYNPIPLALSFEFVDVSEHGTSLQIRLYAICRFCFLY